MQIITTAVIKGGTGKTTTAAALAQAAVSVGLKALAIDLDPQANLSFFIGADQNRPGSYQLLRGKATAAEVIQATQQGIDVISGSPELSQEKTRTGSATRLQTALEPIKNNYDLIVIDTPPQIGEMTYNALCAATGLLIPLEADTSSLQGLYQIVDIATQIQSVNTDLKIKGVVLTRYDSRPKINRYLRDVIAEKGADINAPLLAAIRPGTVVREAQALQLSLYDYGKTSKPAQDYMDLLKTIMA